jgi:hypothetical protein
MPIATHEETEEKVAPPTKQEIAQLMAEIRELYPKSEYMRLEIGTKCSHETPPRSRNRASTAGQSPCRPCRGCREESRSSCMFQEP